MGGHKPGLPHVRQPRAPRGQAQPVPQRIRQQFAIVRNERRHERQRGDDVTGHDHRPGKVMALLPEPIPHVERDDDVRDG